jgi:hypothetical protein
VEIVSLRLQSAHEDLDIRLGPVHRLETYSQDVCGNRVQPDGIAQRSQVHPHFPELPSLVSAVKRQGAVSFLQDLNPLRMLDLSRP